MQKRCYTLVTCIQTDLSLTVSSQHTRKRETEKGRKREAQTSNTKHLSNTGSPTQAKSEQKGGVRGVKVNKRDIKGRCGKKKRKKKYLLSIFINTLVKIGFELVETGTSVPRACDGESCTRAVVAKWWRTVTVFTALRPRLRHSAVTS